MTVKRPIAYITAAWSGNRTADRERAAQYCRQVYEAGYSPLCPMLFLSVFLHESIPHEHKSKMNFTPQVLFFGVKYQNFASQNHKTFPDGLDMAREYLGRSRLLVMCGEQTDETVKNDIAVAQRLHIAATTLEGILTVKGQGQTNEE